MQSRPYSKKVNDWLISTSGCSIGDFCRKFGYPMRETRIVEELDEEDEAKTKSIIRKDKEIMALWKSSIDNSNVKMRMGKNRSLTEFYKTLVTGWVIEDLVISMLKQNGIDVSHNGSDVNRDIDKANSVSQEPDIIVRVGDNTRTVELTCEFNDILKNDGYIEKRAPSLFNLWKKKSLWLYFDLPSGEYILVDYATEPVSLMLRWHELWSKDVHRYNLEDNGKKIRNDRLLFAELISVVGCGIEGKKQPTLNETIDKSSPPHFWELGGNRKRCADESQVNVKCEETVKEPVQSSEEAVCNVELTTDAQQKEGSYVLTDADLGIDGFA